jgi:hypothetical protein
MQARHKRYLTALQTVQRFLDARSAQLGRINATPIRESLNTAISRLKALSAMQEHSTVQTKNGRVTEFRLRKQLICQLLRPIVRFAEAQVPQYAHIEGVRVPSGDVSTMRVVVTARALARFVDTRKAIFAGLAPSLGERVRRAATELEVAIGAKFKHRGDRVRATVEIAMAVSEASKILAVLSAMIHAQCGDDDPLIAEWRIASSVRKSHT